MTYRCSHSWGLGFRTCRQWLYVPTPGATKGAVPEHKDRRLGEERVWDKVSFRAWQPRCRAGETEAQRTKSPPKVMNLL